ncbi:type II secretion system F family protein [Clostridium guangxiense]|uniref:type II secretion system F family protein n=1 Tax=Clostridium guangxiense TaxID=1662055 RepID=UPI001E45C016|nr:type II secretion system F family protein [Clostridium guangxiense]MCD2346462.1 type II secretion system F family protein [Clostridium guangxiense]
MSVYLYEAKTIKGTIENGRIEGEDENEVATYLRKKNCWLVSIREENESGLNADIDMFSKISIKDISIFCRQLSYTLNAGISLNRALNIVEQQTENKRLKKATIKIFEDVERGKGLAEAMKKNKEYPDLLVSMVAAGEASGTLDLIMTRMADYYYSEYKQWQKVKQALTYPIIVAIFAFLIVNFLAIKILPMLITNIVSISGKNEIPWPTKVSIGFSNLVTHNFILIIICAVALVILFKIARKYSVNIKNIDKLKLKLPVVGKLSYKVVTSRFARTFGMLVSSGIPLIKSMDICGEIVNNKFIENSLEEVKDYVKKGSSIGSVLEEKKLFPPMLTQMIKIGEESGNLEDVLKKVAEFYDGEVETAVAQLTTMIEPLIIVVLAFVVGFIVLSIILPIFQMYNDTSSLGIIMHMAGSYL